VVAALQLKQDESLTLTLAFLTIKAPMVLLLPLRITLVEDVLKEYAPMRIALIDPPYELAAKLSATLVFVAAVQLKHDEELTMTLTPSAVVDSVALRLICD
jgi:hypothetical protein